MGAITILGPQAIRPPWLTGYLDLPELEGDRRRRREQELVVQEPVAGVGQLMVAQVAKPRAGGVEKWVLDADVDPRAGRMCSGGSRGSAPRRCELTGGRTRDPTGVTATTIRSARSPII